MSTNFYGNVTIGTHVTVESGGTFIKTKIESGGVNNEYVLAKDKYEEPDGKEKTNVDKSQVLKENISRILPMMKSNRHWFPIVKVMMQKKYVAKGDFSGAAAMINALFDGEELKYRIDSADLSRMDVLSFSKDIDLWTPADAPVQGQSFVQYKTIAEEFFSLFE